MVQLQPHGSRTFCGLQQHSTLAPPKCTHAAARRHEKHNRKPANSQTQGQHTTAINDKTGNLTTLNDKLIINFH